MCHLSWPPEEEEIVQHFSLADWYKHIYIYSICDQWLINLEGVLCVWLGKGGVSEVEGSCFWDTSMQSTRTAMLGGSECNENVKRMLLSWRCCAFTLPTNDYSNTITFDQVISPTRMLYLITLHLIERKRCLSYCLCRYGVYIV